MWVCRNTQTYAKVQKYTCAHTHCFIYTHKHTLYTGALATFVGGVPTDRDPREVVTGGWSSCFPPPIFQSPGLTLPYWLLLEFCDKLWMD